MADFDISGRLSVNGLKKQFKEAFNLELRVYKGQRFADEKATLASLSDKKVTDFKCTGRMLVGNFEKRFEEATGLKVQVATLADAAENPGALVNNDLTLSQASSTKLEKDSKGIPPLNNPVFSNVQDNVDEEKEISRSSQHIANGPQSGKNDNKMPGRQFYIGFSVLALILAVLTNPSEEQHKQAVKAKINEYWQKSMAETYPENEWEQAGQTLGVMFGGALIDGIISNLVTTDRYLIFSTTKISWKGESRVIGIGVFGNVLLTKRIDEALKDGLLKQ